MALITAHVHLPDPGIATGFCLILPENCASVNAEGRYPLLWLPTDRGEAYNAWVRHTAIERMAEKHGFAVAMLDGQRSNYADMKKGPRWYAYLSRELPEYLHQNFPVSAQKAEQFAFGYGMGALGLARMVAQEPDRFCALGLADADLSWFADDREAMSDEQIDWMEAIYGVRNPALIDPKEHMMPIFEALREVKNLRLYCSQSQGMRMWQRVLRTCDDRWQIVEPASDRWDARQKLLEAFIQSMIVPNLGR